MQPINPPFEILASAVNTPNCKKRDFGALQVFRKTYSIKLSLTALTIANENKLSRALYKLTLDYPLIITTTFIKSRERGSVTVVDKIHIRAKKKLL